VLAGQGEIPVNILSLSNCGNIDAGELAQFSNMSSLSIVEYSCDFPEQIGGLTNLTSLQWVILVFQISTFILNLRDYVFLSLSGEEISQLPSLDFDGTHDVASELLFLDNSDMRQIASLTDLPS
jgi:Leucine-rich repeat (LRR) protein